MDETQDVAAYSGMLVDALKLGWKALEYAGRSESPEKWFALSTALEDAVKSMSPTFVSAGQLALVDAIARVDDE